MRLLKVILLGNAIMSLTACYFDSNSSCFKLPQAVYCPKEKKTNIKKYYKNVSDEQKMSDIVNAHVKLHQEIRVWALKSAPP